MSATIMWTPTGKGRTLKASGQSTAFSQICAVFGDDPRLGDGDIGQLRAMAHASQFYMDMFNELADLVESHGEIQVWAEF